MYSNTGKKCIYIHKHTHTHWDAYIVYVESTLYSIPMRGMAHRNWQNLSFSFPKTTSVYLATLAGVQCCARVCVWVCWTTIVRMGKKKANSSRFDSDSTENTYTGLWMLSNRIASKWGWFDKLYWKGGVKTTKYSLQQR